jgi:hypothetical protein
VSETSTTPTASDAEEATRRAEQQRSATRQAIIVVLALTLVAALVIIEFAFSTSNDSQSVDGPTATSSEYVD